MKSKKELTKLLLSGQQTLKNAGINRYNFEAEEIMLRLFGCTRASLYLDEKIALTENLRQQFEYMINKRCKGVPLQYLTGVQNFYGLDFKVDGRVLIPRQDTEVLLQVVLDFAEKKDSGISILDMCTGSGNLAVSLAFRLQNSKVSAVDISKDALDVASENADIYQVAERVNFYKGDLFEPLEEGAKFDLIVSNPPYIASKDIETLEEQVKDFEPKQALDGGEDGLCFYRRIVKSAPLYLRSGGLLAFEIGFDQAKDVCEIISDDGNFTDIAALKDLAGLDRVVTALKKDDSNF